MGLREMLGFSKPRPNLENIFDNIVGHDDAKAVLTMAIESVKPVHVMLKGPFGIGKSELMTDVQKYIGEKNSHWAIGSRTSKAGLSDMFIKNPNLEWLFIDEIETLPRKDQAVLLSITEGGIVSETLFKKTKGRMTKTNVRVIATTNETRQINRALMTRFAVVQMSSYTLDEFVNISIAKSLTENVPQDKIELIARAVYRDFYEPTPRDVIRVARMSKGDDDKIVDCIRILKKKMAEEKK